MPSLTSTRPNSPSPETSSRRLKELQQQLQVAEKTVIERNTRREGLQEERDRLVAFLTEAGYTIDDTLEEQILEAVAQAEKMSLELLEAVNAVS